MEDKIISKEEIKKKPHNCPRCGSEDIILSHTARKALCRGKMCHNIWLF